MPSRDVPYGDVRSVQFRPSPPSLQWSFMNIDIKYRKGRPIFGTLWQRLWWGLGCWSHERRITAHYHVHIYWRIVDGNLESFSLAYNKGNGQLV